MRRFALLLIVTLMTGWYGSAEPALAAPQVLLSPVRYIRQENGQVVQETELEVMVPSISAFGEDHDGELYAISLGGTVFKILPSLA